MTRGSMSRRRRCRRGTALYMLVVGCAAMVSTLGLAALTIARVKARATASAGDSGVARWNANSAVSLALEQLAADLNWRNNLGNGVLSAPASLGAAETGTVSWMISDSDGSLTDGDTHLRVTGVGQAGGAKQVSSIEVLARVAEVGPGIVRAMEDTSGSTTNAKLRSSRAYGQYLKPTLPLGTTSWWVTSISIYCRLVSYNKTFSVKIHLPTASGYPSSTLVDQVSVNSSSLPESKAWYTFEFPSATKLSPDQAICFTLTTTTNAEVVEYDYRSGGVSELESAWIQGDGVTWTSRETDKSFLYRVNGVYTTSTSDLSAVEGTWTWDAAP